MTVYLFSSDGQWAGNSAWDGCNYGYARTEATLPYNPNAEYNVDGEHTADPYLRDDWGDLSTITDTCQGHTVTPGGCSANYTDSRGKFTDQLRTGCPTTGGSCGFTINPNRYQWCPRGRVPVSLARFVYDVRFNQITIDGQTSWPAGKDFSP